MTTTQKTQWTARGIPQAPDVCGVVDYWCGVIDASDPTEWYAKHWVMTRCTVHPNGAITHRVVGPVVNFAGRVVEWFPRVGLLARLRLTDREYREQLARVDLKSSLRPRKGRPTLLDQWDEARPSTAEYHAGRLRELQSRFNC